jgi:deoxyribodipyrimidine photo-lyase
MASSNTETTFISTSDPVDAAMLPSWMMKERTRMLTSDSTKYNKKGKSVVYWMQRDVRTVDNWALLFAAHLAETNQVPLHVVHVLPPPPPNNGDSNSDEIPTLVQMKMTERHGTFLLGGLKCVYEELKDAQVPLHIVLPLSHRLVGDTLYSKLWQELELDPQVVICDFSPLRHIRQWMELQTLPLLEKLEIPLWQVDTRKFPKSPT